MMIATVSPIERTDELSFEDFFEAEYEPLLRAMTVLGRNRSEAEDLAQEAMARAFERWSDVSRAASPRAYVFRIAFNLRRSALRRMVLALRHGASEPLQPHEPETIALKRRELLDALRSIPKSQCEALLLVEWIGMNSEEAGHILGIEPESVRGRVHRARTTLRARLEETMDE